MKMLKSLGPAYLEELRELIPEGLRSRELLNIGDGLSEQEVKSLLEKIAGENSTTKEFSSFLGAGAYNHYVPSVVDHLSGLAGFYTAYTPYQPEISQGTLQAIFEYQTLICQLTGMDVSNASLYDGASATAEAVLMARRVKKQAQGGRVFVSRAVHPEYRETLKTYLADTGSEIVELPFSIETGETELGLINELKEDEETVCLVMQSPNFFGVIEGIGSASEIIKKKGGLLITVVTEPLSMALIKPPGELGADIIVGEAQGLGNYMNFGGPYLGFMACKTPYLRQMPGRIIGEAKDANGNRRFCMTLATREQHIRREKATSNICTNQGLTALRAAIYMTTLGRKALMNLALLNYSKSKYLKKRLTSRFIKPVFIQHSFNEFTVKVNGDYPLTPILEKLLEKKIIAGLELKRFYPELEQFLLISTTEMNSRASIDNYADLMKSILNDAFYEKVQKKATE
jgi:glycine dehydrogenase subunit 1